MMFMCQKQEEHYAQGFSETLGQVLKPLCS